MTDKISAPYYNISFYYRLTILAQHDDVAHTGHTIYADAAKDARPLKFYEKCLPPPVIDYCIDKVASLR